MVATFPRICSRQDLPHNVFSFGILVLEIVKCKRNRRFFNQDQSSNLLVHVAMVKLLFHPVEPLSWDSSAPAVPQIDILGYGTSKFFLMSKQLYGLPIEKTRSTIHLQLF
uniref:Serine-threonine/tyrosine-protein kinase catalytic domain-containing protein n=1 Tax=Solanum lycopersicum TaxID=4081 RepID=A0A3Q7G5Y1_SOLLC